MISPQLRDTIAERGAANAIIYLNPDGNVEDYRVDVSSDGRIRRTAAEFDSLLLDDLYSYLAGGWSDLSQYSGVDIEELARSIPRILELVNGDLERRHETHTLYMPHLGIVYGAINERSLQAIEDHEAVTDVHLAPLDLEPILPPPSSRLLSAPSTSNDGWGLERIGAPDLWKKGLSGKNILIAHLDSGADSAHPLLKDSILNSVYINTDGSEAPAPDPMVDKYPYGHGTQTASIALGRHLKGKPRTGMAPDAKLASAIVLPATRDIFCGRVLGGLEWALSTGARIVNLSIGQSGQDDCLKEVITRLRAKSMLPIAATGNSGPTISYYPGNYDNLLSVGATNQDNTMVYYSGKCESPSLSAPGIYINSAQPGGGTVLDQGTSMAVPHVTGLAALLYEAQPLASVEQIESAILHSCIVPAGANTASVGSGIPNALDALNYL